MSLGSRIKERRQELKLTVLQIATACGVTDKAVYQWESEDTKGLKPENLVCAADILKTTVHWLVTGRGPKAVSVEERELLKRFRELRPRQQHAIQALVEELADEGGSKDSAALR